MDFILLLLLIRFYLIFQHIDITLNYLRKIATYNPDMKYVVTTTDSLFDQNMKTLYKTYLDESNLGCTCIAIFLGFKKTMS